MMKLTVHGALGIWREWRMNTTLALHGLYQLQHELALLLLMGIGGYVLALFQAMQWETLRPGYALILAGVWLVCGNTHWGKRLGLALLCFMVGIGLGMYRPIFEAIPPYLDQEYVRVHGTLHAHEKGFILLTPNVDTRRPARLLLQPKQGQAFSTGQRVCLRGVLSLGHPPRAWGDFNEAQYLKGLGVQATLRGAAIEPDCSPPAQATEGKTPQGVTPFVFRASWQQVQNSVEHSVTTVSNRLLLQRNAFVETAKRILGDSAGSLLGGIVLGDRASPLPAPLKQAFIQTGQIHLVAASGMNVAIVAGTLLFLLNLVPGIPRWVRYAVATLGVLAYGTVTGFPASILRAATMWCFGLWAKYTFKPLHPLSLLLAAVALLILIQPHLVFNLGFQLSVLTTFGIMAVFPPLERCIQRISYGGASAKIAGALLTAGALTGIAQLYASPLLLYAFGILPLHAIPMNTLSGMLVVPLTFVGFMAFGASFFSEFLAAGSLVVLKPLLQLMMTWTMWGATLPHMQWHTVLPPPGWVVALLALLLMVPWHPYLHLNIKGELRTWPHLPTLATLGTLILIGVLYLPYYDAHQIRQVKTPHLQPFPLFPEEMMLYQYRASIPLTGNTPVQSILFITTQPTPYQWRDVASYFKVRHLPPPYEVVYLNPSVARHYRSQEEAAIKRLARKKASNQRMALKKQATLKRQLAAKQLKRLMVQKRKAVKEVRQITKGTLNALTTENRHTLTHQALMDEDVQLASLPDKFQKDVKDVTSSNQTQFKPLLKTDAKGLALVLLEETETPKTTYSLSDSKAAITHPLELKPVTPRKVVVKKTHAQTSKKEKANASKRLKTRRSSKKKRFKTHGRKHSRNPLTPQGNNDLTALYQGAAHALPTTHFSTIQHHAASVLNWVPAGQGLWKLHTPEGYATLTTHWQVTYTANHRRRFTLKQRAEFKAQCPSLHPALQPYSHTLFCTNTAFGLH